jgi:hypothetical protein
MAKTGVRQGAAALAQPRAAREKHILNTTYVAAAKLSAN